MPPDRGLLGADESVHIPERPSVPRGRLAEDQLADIKAKWKDLYGTPPKLNDAMRKSFSDAMADLDRDAAEQAELDEWPATYGRLDIPVTVIDWRPVYAGAAALAIALVAHWVVRHGR